MRRLLFTLLALLACTATLQAQITPVYEQYFDLQTNGDDSSYMQTLTLRYVGTELRFLQLTHQGVLQEFRLPAAGQKQTVTTATWNLSGTGALNSHNGVWWEASKNRLWVTSAEDYTTVNHPAKVTLIALGANGSVTVQKQFFLNVPAKRVYGGCNAVPSSLVGRLGGEYVCGWGGYTSLVAQGGGASMGPTMYAIPNPDTFGNGATVTARTILDTSASRGVRKTLPINFFDGGDPRQNPSSRPTGSPLAAASWLSPNPQGLGWWVWGDSYYNTGMWIGETFAAVASLCKGACWYQDSTLNFDARQFEFHQWAGTGLGSNSLKRPDAMTELTPPQGIVGSWAGNVPQRNVAGAAYDAVSGRMFLVISPAANDWHTGRLYQYRVTEGTAPTPQPDPTPTPTPEPTPNPPTPPQTGLPAGAVQCAIEGETLCTFTGPARAVYYGANGTFVSRITTSPAACTNAAYGGDPLPGQPKRCYVVSTSTPPVEPPPPPPVITAAPPTVSAVIPRSCTAMLTAVAPTGYTVARFRRGSTNLGSSLTAAPYRYTGTFEDGTEVTVRWTASGKTTLTSVATSIDCAD